LVVAERERGRIASVTLELLGIARRIATDLNKSLCAVIIGHENDDVSREIACGENVYSIDHPMLENFRPEIYADVLEQFCKNVNPGAIIMVYTIDNLSLAPRLACKIGVQVITDCVNLAVESGTEHLMCTKPVYGA
jgi:electron transfer flavoprotein alpha subunit